MAPLKKKKIRRKETISEDEIIIKRSSFSRPFASRREGAPASSDSSKKKKRPKRTITTPGKIVFSFDMEKIKSLEESNQGDSIFQFVPSMTNQEQVAYKFIQFRTNQELLFTKNIHPRIEAIKELINASFNFVRNYEFLMDSANEVLRILHCYFEESTKPPHFDWDRNVYRPPFRSPDAIKLLPAAKDCVNICKLAENGCASVYPDSPVIAEADRLTVDKGHALTQPMLDQNIPLGYHLPLNEKERKIWLDFKKLDEGNPESVLINFKFEDDEKRSVILSDPLVSVIGGFAVAAFNKACAMHFKEDEQNNLHDFEYMECKYVKDTKDYFFYMTIEAIEEGNLGVYETIVVCSRDDGRRTLLKFVLTDRTPVGTKAMALSFFSCLRYLCKTLKHVGNGRINQISLMHKLAKGVFKGMAFHEVILFDHFHREIVKGIRRVLALNLQLLFQPDCIRTSNPDTWSVPNPDIDTGMTPRNNGTPCKGYDYNHYNQYLMGSCSV